MKNRQQATYNSHSLGNVTIRATSAGIGFQKEGPSEYGYDGEYIVFNRDPGVGEVKDKIPDTLSGAFCYKNIDFVLPPGF